MNRIFLIICVLCLIGCSGKEKVETKSDQLNQTNSSTSTKKLVQEAQLLLNPMEVDYTLNKERAKIYLKESQSQTGIPKLNNLIKYCTEMINSGETLPAIDKMEQVIKEAENIELKNKEKVIMMLKRVLVIAHMRLGEQENCIEKHNHESCIIPIQKDGIHTLTRGSEKAISILNEMLAFNPRNAEALWILNLAYMTLGKYPQDVPKQFLLPPSYFEKNKEFIKPFDNLASKMGIGHHLLSGAVIMEDFDMDGDIDIFCSSWGFKDNVMYYENDGKGSFQDKTDAKGLTGHVGGLNIKQTDYNNDGLIDIYIMRGAWLLPDGAIPNTLLKNTGQGFKDVTLELGLIKHAPTQACEWYDINKDGWLDLIAFNESGKGKNYPNQLWLNQKGNKFIDVAKEAGIDKTAFFKAISIGDLNNDGHADIYASILDQDNMLFINKGLNKNMVPQFEEVSKSAGTTKPEVSFPTMIFDYNNDGFNDILVSSYKSRIGSPATDFALNVAGMPTGGETLLYINKGDGTFAEVHEQVGLSEAIYSMGCNYGDLDNDGWLDIYLGTGDPSFYSLIPNKVFLNNKGKSMTDVSYASGMAHIQKGHGVSMTDLDRDGHVDVYAVMGGAYEGDNFQNAFFHNPGNSNNSVTLKLVGVTSNKQAIGAKLKVTIEEGGKERELYRVISSGASFGSNSLELLIGIGNATEIKQLEITWPNQENQVQVFKNMAGNKYYNITEGNDSFESKDRQPVKFMLDKMHMHH